TCCGTCSLPSINTLLCADADAVCGADYRAGSDEELDDLRSQNWPFVAAEPAVWSSLRDLSFGLLDGGDVHDDAVRSLLGVGGQRYVLGDQRLISPPPEVPLWRPSEPIAALGIGPGSVRSVVDVEWAAGWVEALDGLIADLKASIGGEGSEDPADIGDGHGAEVPGASKSSDDRTGADAESETRFDALAEPATSVQDRVPIGLSDVQLLNLAERDLARLQAARKIAKHSLLWGLGEHLYDEYQKVQQFLTNLREQKQQAEEEAADLASI